jgi:hypothetical protein
MCVCFAFVPDIVFLERVDVEVSVSLRFRFPGVPKKQVTMLAQSIQRDFGTRCLRVGTVYHRKYDAMCIPELRTWGCRTQLLLRVGTSSNRHIN